MKFIADSMLGRLAKWLRLLGYDTEYFKGKSDSELIYESIRQKRIILTRDNKISRNKPLKIIYIKSEKFTEQIRQLVKDLNIGIDRKNIFTRCVECNMELIKIEKDKVKKTVPPHIFETQERFSYCQKCKKTYWRGTHIQLAENLIEQL